MKVLALDKTGTPFSWLTAERACHYYATDKVAYDFGDYSFTFHGGIQRASGIQSEISIKSIVSLRDRSLRSNIASLIVPDRGNPLLFARDLNTCAYCGGVFTDDDLTRDHIRPKSRLGNNAWMNLVSACFSCNSKKDNRTPEEARMHLLYLPYVPCKHEKLILSNRKILADQMEFLKLKLPKHSRQRDWND